MALIDNPTSDLLNRVLAYHDLKHGVISANVANASTPGYRAFDLVLREKLGSPKPLAPKRTHPLHIALNPKLDETGALLQRSKAPARLDGNNVSMEQEFLKLLENRALYQAGMELLDRWGGLGRMAREIR